MSNTDLCRTLLTKIYRDDNFVSNIYQTQLQCYVPMMQSSITEHSFRTVRERILGYANEDIDEVEIRFEWDVPHIIIKSCFNCGLSNANEELWSPATHVVILKNSAVDNDLMATTCEEYLTRKLG